MLPVGIVTPAASNSTPQQQPEGALNEPEDEDEEDEDDEGDIDGPAVESHVNLAKTVCKSDIFYKCITTADNGLQ